MGQFKFIQLLILLILCSCSAEKRIANILKKNPDAISVIDVDTTIRDTIIEKDTIITKEYRDSFVISTDTIIETNRVIIERIKDRFNVTVKKDTLTLLDTIYYAKEVKVKGKVIEVTKLPKWFWYLISFFVGLIVFVIWGKKS